MRLIEFAMLLACVVNVLILCSCIKSAMEIKRRIEKMREDLPDDD